MANEKDFRTRGMELQDQLGLTEYRYVYLTRAIFGDVFFIIFDSRHPYRPISRHTLEHHPALKMLQQKGSHIKMAKQTPPLHIQKFNGRLDHNDLYLLADLARRNI